MKIRWIVIVSAILLFGCGQRGNLYLPEPLPLPAPQQLEVNK